MSLRLFPRFLQEKWLREDMYTPQGVLK